MPDLSLRGQCLEAQRLVDTGLPADAKVICYRVLEAFPRYVAAYAVLGQAYVRLGDRDTGADIFGRVLGADPESVPAHQGLASIYERRGRLEQAYWHAERAFEMAPGDAEIRAGIARLRHGGAPETQPRVDLTRAALARVYMRGHLYSKAIWELGELLRDMPRRLDLRVALCEAQWRSGDVDGAASVTQGVLAELPNCLKACLILGRIWLEGGRENEGRTLLQRAQALDPDNRVASSLFGSRSPLPPRVSRLPAREGDLPPLDLPYLDVEDSSDVIDESPKQSETETTVNRIPIHGATVHIGVPVPGRADSHGQGDSLKGAAPDLAEEQSRATAQTPSSPNREQTPDSVEGTAAWEDVGDLSLIELQRRYVIENPDDAQARLDLARRYRDGLKVDEALEHYEWLILNDYSLLKEAIADLEFLYRLRPRSEGVSRLLVEARRRESRLPK